MTIIDRLKLELAHKDYFTDTEFNAFLSENGIDDSSITYDKSVHQLALLTTVRDILEALSNNIELYMRIQTEFTTVGSAYANLEKRIDAIEKRIEQLPTYEPTAKSFSYIYFN